MIRERGNPIARFSVRQRVLVSLLFLILMVAGALAGRRIAVDAYPNVDLDAAAIRTVWIGASTEEIDTLVTSKIEDELSGIRGIDRIVSDSRPDRSNILVKFKETLGQAAVDRAFQDIRAALERIDDLPKDAEKPVLERQTIFEIFPLVSVGIGYARPELEKTARDIAKDLRDRLLAIDGVAKVEDRNLRDLEISVLVDRERAERYGLTLEEIVRKLRETNKDVPAGEVRPKGVAEIGIRAAGRYKTARDVEETILRDDPDGASVKVADVARVVDGFKKQDFRSRFNGKDAIILPVAKEEGGNSVAIVDAVRAELKKFRARGLPAGIELGIALDSSQIIRDRLRILLSNLLTGVVFVFLALWAGIGVRNAILAILGIPFCYLVALLFLQGTGVSVNAISLFAMVLVSGVLVDDALIVLENIYRLLEGGMQLRRAVVRGTTEVFWPVTSSTLTTLAAFLPLLLMVGVTGKFFAIIPKVVTVTLLASLFECFVVLPAHYLDFGQRPRKRNGRTAPFSRALAGMKRRYERWLALCMRHRYACLGLLVALSVLATATWRSLDTLLFPSDFQVFMVNMEMPAEANLQETADAARGVDLVLAQMNRKGKYAGQIDSWTTSIGAMATPDNQILLAPSVAQAFVSLRQGTGVDPVDIKNDASRLLERIQAHPEGEAEEREAGLLRRFSKVSATPLQDGPPTGKPIAVRIQCDDLDEAEVVAGSIKAALRATPGVFDVADNHDEGRVEMEWKLEPELAAAQGISFDRFAVTLSAANEGVVVSTFKDPGGRDDADVRVRLRPQDRRNARDLEAVKIRNSAGAAVPLGSIARIEASRSDAGIYRYDGRRTVLVTADLDQHRNTATAVNEAMQRRFDTPEFLNAHSGVSLRFGGEFEETQKSFRSLGEAFYVAVLAIYMILAAQFRSYLLPFVILLTVPFAFIGVVFGLFVTGNPFTIAAGIAMIGLAGIAVNDAIVLIDFINARRTESRPVVSAVREACRVRARPILLTSVTTIAGLLPMALGLTGFSKVWSPFAATMCFGIFFSTILTLLVIPAAYLVVEDGKALLARLRTSRLPTTD